MSINWQGGLEGAGAGYMTAGPWGALAGGIMGLFGGDDTSEDAYEAMEAYYQQQAAIAAQQWQIYQQYYVPQIESMATELQKGPQAEKYAQMASADVMQSFGKARDSTMRNLQRFGIDPRSGAGTSQMKQTDMQVAAAEAGAKNQARLGAEERHRRNIMDFLRTGTGIPSQASAQFGSAAVGAGNLAQAGQAAQEGFGNLVGGVIERASQSDWWKGLPGNEPRYTAQPAPVEMTGIYGNTTEGRPIGGVADGGKIEGYADGGSPNFWWRGGGQRKPAGGFTPRFGFNRWMRRYAAGGPVNGPGGPVDDQIPAMLSDGEYVLPADTTQAVGEGNLDQLVDKTHVPAEQQSAAYQQKTALDSFKKDQPITININVAQAPTQGFGQGERRNQLEAATEGYGSAEATPTNTVPGSQKWTEWNSEAEERWLYLGAKEDTTDAELQELNDLTRLRDESLQQSYADGGSATAGFGQGQRKKELKAATGGYSGNGKETSVPGAQNWQSWGQEADDRMMYLGTKKDLTDAEQKELDNLVKLRDKSVPRSYANGGVARFKDDEHGRLRRADGGVARFRDDEHGRLKRADGGEVKYEDDEHGALDSFKREPKPRTGKKPKEAPKGDIERKTLKSPTTESILEKARKRTRRGGKASRLQKENAELKQKLKAFQK